MKKKISRILGVGLTIVLLASLMVATVPASAYTLSWGYEKNPEDLVENQVLAGLNILDLATSGSTVYAAGVWSEPIKWVVETQSDTTVVVTFTITYTDQDGNTLDTATASSVSVNATDGTSGTISLGADTGVRDVTNIVSVGGAWSGAGYGVVAIKGSTSGKTLGTIDYTDAFTDGAAKDIPACQYPILKSTDGGETWSNLKTSTSFPEGVSVTAIGMASDDPDVLAIITSADQVEYSTNGGSSWSDLDAPAASSSFYDIDVSEGTTRYLAVVGTNSIGGAELWTIKAAMAQSWTARSNKAGFDTSHEVAMAVKCSPSFVTDKIMLVVTGNTATPDTAAKLQAFRYESGAETWNGDIAFFDSWDTAEFATGVELTSNTGTTGILNGGLAAADIAMPSSYLGTDEGERIAFVALAGLNSGGGVLRITDTYDKGFQTWSAGDEGQIGTLAYHESGKIVAGAYDENKVFQFLSPMSTTPKASRLNTLKQPGGVMWTVVRWAGDTAVAGTYGTGSAFAKSTDDGNAWNDLSLVGTSLSGISDVAVNADGSKVYLAANDGTTTRIWLKASSWLGVLTVPTASTDVIVRIAPDNDEVVYVAVRGTQDIWVSKNSGQTSWKHVPCYKLGTNDTIRDMAVESADVAYVIDDDGMSKTTNAGASWGSQKRPTDAVTPYMIALAPNNDVLVGTTEGYVAFSKDGGSTYERTVDGGAGNVQVCADDGYADNNIIYIGIGTSIKRGKADTTSSWATRGTTASTIYGIAQYEGTVYVLDSDGTDSNSYKSYKLETVATIALAEWTSDSSAGEDFGLAPKALKLSVSGTKIKLWSVAVNVPDIYSFTDAVALTGPTMLSPETNYSVPVNIGTGQAYNVTFTWERYSDSDVETTQMQIATDDNFDGIIYTGTFDITGLTTDTIALAIGPTGVEGPPSQRVDLMPGQTYYWRVRTTEPMNSPWSETRSLTVEGVVAFVITVPAVGATDVSISPTLTWGEYSGALAYELMIAEDPTFSIADISVTTENPFYKVEEALPYSTTYYWRVRAQTTEAQVAGEKYQYYVPPETTDWITGIFTTEAEPVEEVPTVIVEKEPAPPAEVTIVEVPVTQPSAIPGGVLWAIVVIGAVLVIALIVLIVRTRRVA